MCIRDRPITIVCPFAAGGATDVLARILSDPMGKALGQTIVVEDLAGAAGGIGVAKVVHSPADGYTLSVGTLTTHVLIGGLYKLDFDLLGDLTPIAELAYEPLLICVKNSLPVKNLTELIAWLKANPGKACVGIPGIGSTGNLAGISFQKATGTTFQFVPYRGDGPAVQDMMAGQIDMMIEPSSNFTAQVQAGTIRAIAVSYTHLDVYKRQVLLYGHKKRVPPHDVAAALHAAAFRSVAANGPLIESVAELSERYAIGSRASMASPALSCVLAGRDAMTCRL